MYDGSTRDPERPAILNTRFSDAASTVLAAFLADDHGRFLAEIEAVKL